VAYNGGTTDARPIGVRAVLSCGTGFFFVWNTGDVNRVCQGDVTWSGITGTCEGLQLLDLDLFIN